MSNDQPTAKIPRENVPQLRTKIEKLNKVADKLGCPPIILRIGQPETQEVNQGIVMLTGPHAAPGQSVLYQEVVPVWVAGEAPRVNGWEFVATLEHDENGTLIRRIPNFADEVDLSQYRTATPDNCDHCGYKRRRNDTYIVVSETGETKQAGSNCLKDFTGHENPQAIARFLEQVRDLIEAVSGGGYSEGRLIPRYDLRELMATAVMVVRDAGYVSRQMANDSGHMPTVERVRIEFYDRIDGKHPTVAPDEADYDKALKIIDWVRSLTEDDLGSDYLYNLYTVCKTGTLTSRQFGIAASATVAYDRVQERLARQQQSRTERVDGFLGEEGGRIDVTFKVTQIFHDDSEYGVQHKHIMVTDTGHRLTWRTGTFELEQDKTYHGNFSVKKHYEGRYGKETQINRPRKGDPQEVDR